MKRYYPADESVVEGEAELQEAFDLEEEPTPYVPSNAEEIESYPPFPFPELLGFKSSEWKDTGESWFVDNSGFGAKDELALTPDQFKASLLGYHKAYPTHGFGITAVGQFQVYVSAFAPC